MNVEKQFLADIEGYLDQTGMKPYVLGLQTVNDPAFVKDLREGRSCSLRLASKVREFMELNPPPPQTENNRSNKGA